MNLTIKQKNPILTYPLDVVQDGHHILLTIFETEGVSYQSPYTDVNIASNKLNNAKRQSLGLSTAKSNKLMNAVAKVVGANSKINRAYDRVGASAFGSQNYKTKKRDSRTFAGQGNAKKKNFNAIVKNSTDQISNVSLQGPKSREILKKIIFTPPTQPSIDELGWFRFTICRIEELQGIPLIVSRTGYTG